MDSRTLKSVCLVMATTCLALLPMGCKKAPPITLACNAAPPAIYAGDPVNVTATAGSVNPKKNINVLYSWSGDGVTGSGAAATVATGTLAPGSYTVKAAVKEGKKGKEGLKPGESAECSASYTVKEFEPPTISCSTSPTTIKPGESSNITAAGVSPQNRPLTYSFAAAAGTVSVSGNAAVFSSIGAPTGPVEITCKVADDKGHTAAAGAAVTILAPPPPPPIPHVQALCGLSFDSDKTRPTRVNNEAKACLDEIALNLQRQPDAKAVMVGTADAKEQAKTAKEVKFAARHKHAKVVDLAVLRAVNAKDYLVTEKGIDASRISIATSAAETQKVDDYIVPAGATFANDVQGTTPANDTAVKPEARKALPARHHKHAAK